MDTASKEKTFFRVLVHDFLSELFRTDVYSRLPDSHFVRIIIATHLHVGTNVGTHVGIHVGIRKTAYFVEHKAMRFRKTNVPSDKVSTCPFIYQRHNTRWYSLGLSYRNKPRP